MENNKNTKKYLIIIMIIVAIIASIILGYFIFNLFRNKSINIGNSSSQISHLSDQKETIQNKTNSNFVNPNIATNTEKTPSENISQNVNTQESINNNQSITKNYTNFIGTWYNTSTQNEVSIKNISENSLTFTWMLYKTSNIDEDTTVNFSNGEAIFYFEGYDDKNLDGVNAEDEKFIRKATIKLAETGVNINIERTNSINGNYKVLKNINGAINITEGIYTHPDKR